MAYFPGMGGEFVPCTVFGTAMESEFVVGHKHLVALSVLLYSFSTSGLQDPPSYSWAAGRGMDKSQLRMGREAAQS